tara:strand:+ start:143 stop:496 length:354 start_codon:yes stop_codon:yes gene_type:complete
MKTYRQFTEDYVDSYALHRTSTGPGINSYVPVANLNAQRAKQAVAGGKVQKFVTAHGLKFKGKVYKEIDMELVKINNSTQMVKFKIIAPKELVGNETNIHFKPLRRGPFMATVTSKP